jgi:hypothetical protein
LSKLLCTCRGMKEMILKYKIIFPIQEYTTGVSLTDKIFENMILHYSSNIKKLIISSRCSALTFNGYYQHVFLLLRSNLLELELLEGDSSIKKWDVEIPNITSSLLNLTSLRILNSLESQTNLSSISQLTNLEKLDFDNCYHLDEFNLESYSALTKIKSICISRFSGKRLDWFFETNKVLLTLVEIKIDTCERISSENYHCLGILTNLTHLSFSRCNFDDFGLNLICSCCLLIEYLYFHDNDELTIEGFNNVHFLVNLKSLHCILYPNSKNCLLITKLYHNVAITHLTMFNNDGVDDLSNLFNLSYLCLHGHGGRINLSTVLSCLVNLTNLELHCCRIIHDGREISNIITSLSQVKIDKCVIGLNILSQHLSKLVNLSHLNLTNSKIPIEEFYYLSFCTNLTFLDLSESPSSNSGLSHLSSLILLTHLKFCGVNITDEGLAFLVFLSKTLTYLEIHGGHSFIICHLEEGYKYLASCVKLTYLTLSRCIFVKGVSFLERMSKLTYLDLGPTYMVEHNELCMISELKIRVLKIANSLHLFPTHNTK